MTEYAVVPATREHAEELGRTMSPATRDECIAWGGTPEAAVLYSFNVSRDCLVMLADGRPVAIWGVMTPTALSTTATIWMLGATELPQHFRFFLRLCRATIERWRKGHKRLANYVDVRHTVSVRWLGWMGFSFDPPQPFGPHGMPFMRFHMEGEG